MVQIEILCPPPYKLNYKYACVALQIKVLPYHINDPEFANSVVDSFLEISKKDLKDITPQVAKSGSDHDIIGSSVTCTVSSNIWSSFYSPTDYPDARPGWSLVN